MSVCLYSSGNTNGEKISLWWWEPLWFYICKNCTDILTPKQIKIGYNDTFMTIFSDETLGITTEKMVKIVNKLETLLKEGKVKEYEKNYTQDIHWYGDKLKWLCHWSGNEEHNDLVDCIKTVLPYKFSEKFVAKFIECCKNGGGFTIG